jgi:predicted metalloprotease with PDZ domain
MRLTALSLLLLTTALQAAPAIDAPRDHAFKGTMTLAVDATDIDHQIFSIVQTIPVQRAGPLTLLYPQWETGSHAPTATVTELAGLVVQADGKPLAWRRDGVDVHAFHLDVPAGVQTLTLHMQFLAAPTSALLRPEMTIVPWQRMLLYPAGWFARKLPVAAQVTLPPGQMLVSALEVDLTAGASATTSAGAVVRMAPVPLDLLVDAPAYAARQQRTIVLGAAGAAGAAPVTLDVLADDAANLAVPAAEVEKLRALVTQTARVFGPPPFRRYHVMVTLSDVVPSAGGIEHLEEGENNLPSTYFSDPAHQLSNRDLLAHEYVHAWNGVFRQPADLWSPNFNTPVQGSLLWMYEGQTEFWGRVLAARTGMRTLQETLDKIALDAALVGNRAGRRWKSLADSLNDAVYMAGGHAVAWRDWQRREDYYPEGVLLWLDIEARLRTLSAGKAGLDDFARRFFSTAGKTAPSLYTFDDVCTVLDSVAHANWRAILQRHLDTHDDADALAGLAQAGWRLSYSDSPTETYRQDEADAGTGNFDYSIGVQVRANGGVRGVSWEGPAFRAGLAPGARILAVNGAPFAIDTLQHAVAAAAAAPLMLDIESGGRRRTVAVDYHGTLRYPRLERIPGTTDRLTPLLMAR